MSSQTLQLTSECDDVDNMSDDDSDWRHSAEDSCDDDDDDIECSSVQFDITDCNPCTTFLVSVLFVY